VGLLAQTVAGLQVELANHDLKEFSAVIKPESLAAVREQLIENREGTLGLLRGLVPPAKVDAPVVSPPPAPIHNLEQLEAAGLENMLREGATAVAEVAALSHEKTVIDAALAAVGAGTGKTWNDAADPISDVDDAILAVIKAAKYGSLMGVGILFGATAWKIFKNQAKVRGRFVVGNGGGKASLGLAVPTEDSASQMFVGTPDVRTSYMIYDAAPEGKAENVNFLLDSTILVFARKQAPSRRDPSFMKTFRLMNQFMVPGSYTRDDGRVEVAKFDWSEDVKVVNSAACVRLNVAAA